MQLIGVARHRPGLGGHFGDRRRIQSAHALRHVRMQAAPQLHRPRPPLFEGRVIEISVRIGIENLVRERRRLSRIHGDGFNRAALNAGQQRFEPLQVHRFPQAVGNGFRNQRMIGDADLARQILRASGLIGKHSRQQIVGLHALDRRRSPAPASEAQHSQRPRSIPAPARRKHGRRQQGLRQHRLHSFGAQEFENDLQGERVLLAQRNDNAVVGGGRLQLQIERPAESFAQRQPPGPVDARSEGSVQHQLHAAGFVEEALGDHPAMRRQRAQSGLPGQRIFGGLLRRHALQAAFANQQLHALSQWQRRDPLAQPRHFAREFQRAPRRLSVPERNRRRRAMRILHAHAPRLHAPDAP